MGLMIRDHSLYLSGFVSVNNTLRLQLSVSYFFSHFLDGIPLQLKPAHLKKEGTPLLYNEIRLFNTFYVFSASTFTFNTACDAFYLYWTTG
jgi:hypothetical protein